MTVFKAKDVKSSLSKKGFIDEGGDHHYFVYYVDGKRTQVFTKTSRNDQDINDNLISMMAKQTHLSIKDFKDLINCPLSKECYKEILKNNNII